MNAKGYSEAIYTAIQNGVKPADALSRLKAILSRHGHVPLYARILEGLETQLTQDASRNVARVRVARKGDVAKFKKEIEAFRKQLDLEKEEVTVDESLIGGYVLEGKGTRTDASYKTSLLSIYQSLIK